MSRSNWFGDDDQKGNFSNDKKDTFDPKKRYIGIRLQQGVPLLDRDWNELEDIRRYEEQMLRKWYIGDGISGNNGFKIIALDERGDDFKIHRGACLVDGLLAMNRTGDANFILYSDQTEGEADPENISELAECTVYLDVWIEEVNRDEDHDLANEDDVEMETCIRHKLKWRVRVRSKDLIPKKYHHYYDLATIKRENKTDPIKEANITDIRRTGLALYHLVDALKVDGHGNVGIGTEKLSRPLHVEGSEIHSGGSVGGFSFADRVKKDFVGSPTKGERWVWYSADGIARLWSGTDKLSITHDGKVGVGKTAPSGKLTVDGVSTGQTGFEVLGGVGNSHIPFSDGQIYLTGDISKKATGSGALVFRAYDGKDSFNRFVIDGKTGNTTIYHAAVKGSTSKDNINLGLKLQSPDGGGVVGYDINNSIFFRVGRDRDSTENVCDYYQFGTHRFFTGGVIEKQKERMRIDQNGNVAIGTTAPSRALHVEGSEIHSGGGFSFADRDKRGFVEIPSKGERWVWYSAGGVARLWSGSDKLTIDKDGNLWTQGKFGGNIQIKDTRGDNTPPKNFNRELSFDFKERGVVGAPGAGRYSGMITLAPWSDNTGNSHHQLNFNDSGIYWRKGDADGDSWKEWVQIHMTSASDERLKASIMPLTHVLDKLDKVRGISFEWNGLYESLGYPKNGGRREIGLIAQEVEAVFPELVTSHGDEKYRVLHYEKLTAVLVEAVKELKAEMDALKRKIAY